MKKLKLAICPVILLFCALMATGQCGTYPLAGTNTISSSNQIVNSYYPGQGNPVIGNLSLTAGTRDSRGSTSPIAAGDLVFIVQMQGADINTTNTDSYGDGVSGGAGSGYLTANLFAGYYEYNTVLSVAGSTINLSYSLANNYYTRSFAGGAIQTYQVIRIPREYNLTIASGASVTAPSWNGSTGGIVVMDASNIITINGSISVNGLGFRGGGGINFTGATAGNSNGAGTLTNTDYRWNSPITNAANLTGGAKGEGIAGTPAYVLPTGAVTITTNAAEGYVNGSLGRGAPGTAGGGGTDGAPVGIGQNQYNSGGGGGANAGNGGLGGSGWHGGAGNVNTYPTGGYGGSQFTQRSIGRLIMGGGGGAGTADNSSAAEQYQSSGAAGGGIIIIRAKSFAGNGSITADGADAVGITNSISSGANTDAAGGGGAGGTIVAVSNQAGTVGLNTVTASANGGKGGNMEIDYDHGPGGGGGGGYIITNGVFSSAAITGGANGLTRTGTFGGAVGPVVNAYGATSGGNGQLATVAGVPALGNPNNVTSPCGTLPITLTSFKALLNGNNVLLTWKVDNAADFLLFEIEYSTDGINFTKIGETAFYSNQSEYRFTHSLVTAAVNYYRLKLVDISTRFRYSNILVIKTANNASGISIYPQPANDYIAVSLSAQKNQMIAIHIFNAAGIKVKDEMISLNRGQNLFTIDNLQAMPSGIYLLKTMLDERLVTAKVIIGGK